jgi:septal ring factor EnvC (AmiA/AmiB activator)
MLFMLQEVCAQPDTLRSDSITKSGIELRTGLEEALIEHQRLETGNRNLEYYNRFLVFALGALILVLVFVLVLLLVMLGRNSVKRRKIGILEQQCEELMSHIRRMETMQKTLSTAFHYEELESLRESFQRLEKEKQYLEKELSEIGKSLTEEQQTREAVEKEISRLLKELKSSHK